VAEVVDAACDGRVRRWAKPYCDLKIFSQWVRSYENSTAKPKVCEFATRKHPKENISSIFEPRITARLSG